MGRADYTESATQNRIASVGLGDVPEPRSEGRVQTDVRPCDWPLSFAQQRLWFLEQLDSGNAAYNMPLVARLTGPFNLAAFQKALQAMEARHESLRTRFTAENGRPRQVIEKETRLRLRLEDFSGLADSEKEIQSKRRIREEINRPFKLNEGHLIRVLVLRLLACEHILVLTMHHIVSDEWSLNIFFRELGAFYEGFALGDGVSLPELPIQYADFAVWQHDWLKGEALEEQLGFWREQLEGSPVTLEMPTDFSRRQTVVSRGCSRTRFLSKEMEISLRQLGRREEATLFMVLLAAFNALLYRYTQQEDIIVSSPMAGRNRLELEGLIGFFVNILPLRARVSGKASLLELLRQVREVTLAACSHQEAPFEKIVEKLHPERAVSEMPFARVVFMVQNSSFERMRWRSRTTDKGEAEPCGTDDSESAFLDIHFLDAQTDGSKFELCVNVQETTLGLAVRAEYNSSLFTERTIDRLLEHFETLLHGILANPECRLSEMPLLSDAERKQLLMEWNNTASDYPRNKCIHQLFEEQAQRAPHALAAVFGARSVTYSELNTRANQLARYLRRYGVEPNTPVALCVHPSVEMLVGMLAILKAGGAYVPLDAGYPAERLAFMLRDTRVPVVLTQESLVNRIPADFPNIVCLDTDWELIARESGANPCTSVAASDLAYVMYTSGSTGQPKGVRVPHRAVVRLVLSTNYVRLEPADRLGQISNISFDAATFEIWGALLNGAALVGIARDTVVSPKEFAHELKRQGITTIFLTSALFAQVADQVPNAFESLRTVIVGGEAVDAKSIRTVLRNGPPQALVNGYGPTENTTFTCCHHIAQLSENTTNVPIGRAISNTQVYILDSFLNPVPIGVVGEIYTGGDGLADGYWDRPDLTTEKFVPNPFFHDWTPENRPSRLLYRTGDLARYLPSGEIEFLGRTDGQVKIRGFRVELGEIEATLRKHPAIRDCALTVFETDAKEKRLIAYFVPKAGEKLTGSELRRFVKKSLPEYMVPSSFGAIESLPLTANGKLDRNALPNLNSIPAQGETYQHPRDEIEARLAKIWEEVLDTRPIGVRDKFFDLGGHSLLAVRLVSRIENEFSRKLRVASVFQAPTVEELARLIREETSEPELKSSIVEIQSAGDRPPLFLVHGAGGGMFWGYANLSQRLGHSQPVYAFRSRGLDGQPEFSTIEEMAAQYVSDLRRYQPHGPYYLGGYCFGGNVAYEMARQLTGGGEKVGLLALMNCAPPNSAYTRIRWTPRWCVRLLKNLAYWAQYVRQLTPAQRREFGRWKWHRLKQWLRGEGQPSVEHVDVGNLVDLSSFSTEERRVWEEHIRALLKYQPRPYDGKVHLFRSPGHPVLCSFDPDYGWTEFAKGGVATFVVGGAHEKILDEPCVAAVAAELEKLLNPGNQTKPLPIQNPMDLERIVEIPVHVKRGDDLAYWKKQLSGAPALLEFPADHSRPAVQSGQSDTESRKLAEALHVRFGEDRFAVVLTALLVLLRRYTNQDDLVIATSLDGAPSWNLLVLRIGTLGNPTVNELTQEVRRIRDEAAKHASMPFSRIVEELCPDPDSSYQPLCQIAFSASEIREQGEEFDLWFQLSGTSSSILTCRFAKDLYEADTIRRFLAQWETALRDILDRPNCRVSHVAILPPEEQRLLLVDWNSARTEYPREKTLFQLFELQAERTPAAEALVCGSTRLTYAELLARANAVAHKLRDFGVEPESLVGIFLDRCWEMVAGILGTLKAGGAYVPMDPAYPKERIAFMLNDARVKVLLSQRKQLDLLPQTGAQTICLDEFDWENAKSRACAPREPAASDALNKSPLAYVIYTSGSTGTPKGVAIEHCNAVAFVRWAKEVFSQEELSGVLASTSICFDLSVFEIFVPLCCGGKVILAENALALPSLSAANEVRLINTVPSAIRELLRLKGVPQSVRVVNLAGEPLATSLVNEIYHETAVEKVYDLYGPTETTTYSTFTLRKPDEPPSIGRPLSNEQVYLLDTNMQPVPIGVPGDLYIGGDGVARGYLNRPELTAEKFIRNPFHDDSFGGDTGNRLYKTGDLARWRPDGRLEFLGRRDHQVKIRGFRIELGEIETVLKKQPGVREAVVLAREDQPGTKRLVAYVATGSAPDGTSLDKSISAAKLRESLKTMLPAYMLPSAFILMEALPLTPNGKVDRKALPEPPDDRNGLLQDFIPPSTPIEQELAAIWREVLHMNEIGVRDNFFDLGGNSLLAVQIVSRARESFNVDLPIATLFESPTISTMAERVVGTVPIGDSPQIAPLEPISRQSHLPVSFVQERLWFLDQLVPENSAYNVPIAFRLKGALDREAFQKAFDYLMARHESLRTTFRFADENLTQVISNEISLKIPVIDLQNGEAHSASVDARLKEFVNREAQLRFDLVQGPLIRAKLFRVEETDHVFIAVMHHTICDGWSLGIFFKEFETVYRAITEAAPHPELPPLSIQYADFAAWRRRTLGGATLENELNYWKQKLAGAAPAIGLPRDRDDMQMVAPRAGHITVQLPSALARALLKFSRQEGTTPFVVMMAALAITLRKWTGQKDMVIGTVVAGRNRRELENVIGCFMNFLPLRIPIEGAETGREILSTVREVAIEAQNHQDCPFEKIVEAINPERNSSRNPLYNVALLFQNFSLEFFSEGPLRARPFPAVLNAALLDLRFEVEQISEGLSVLCEYNAELFEHATVEQLIASCQQVLETLVRAPDRTLDDFPSVATAKPAEILRDQETADRHETSEPSENGQGQRIAIAATFTAEPLGDPLRYWSERLEIPAAIEFAPYNQAFQQLLDPSSLFGTNQRGLNVILVRLEDWYGSGEASAQEPNAIDIGSVERSLAEFAAILKDASVRSAVPYLVCICPPSDKARATEQLSALENSVAIRLESLSGIHVLTSSELERLYPVADYYDASGDELGHVPYTPQFFTALATAIARKFHALNRRPYKVIVLDLDQTLWSGVCGEDGPQGICVDEPRMALQKFMRAQRDAGMLLCICSKNNEEDVWPIFEKRRDMPLSREHFAAWRLNWRPKSENLKALAKELRLSLESFIFVDDNPVECAEVEANCPGVLTLLLPEEPQFIPQFLRHCWIFDQLKTTAEDRNRGEMYRQNQEREQLRARSSTLLDFLGGLDIKIEINPMSEEQLPRVAQLTQRTNQFNCTTQRRSEAEIRGLLASAEVFTASVKDRFGDYGLTGVMICKTKGRALDVETFLLSCRILGRGIEHRMLARLGEIAQERHLDWVDVHFNPSPKNKPALDFLHTIGEGFRQPLNGGYVFRFPSTFAARVVYRPPDNETEPVQDNQKRPDDARNGAANHSNVLVCRQIAFESNDLAEIHARIESKTIARTGNRTSYVAPRTDLETQFCEIWQRLLHIDRVGIDENFFEIGGHSLLAVRLFAEINRVTGKKLPLVTIFQSPTVQQLAQALSAGHAELSRSLLVPLQPRGSKPPLFLVHGAGGDVLWGYANLSVHISPDQPIYGIKSSGQAGRDEFTRIDEMAACYVREVRAFQPHGPYYLGGYCFGGNVAYEMARELRSQGEQVALVALLDSAPANSGYEKIHWWAPSYGVRFVRNLYYWLSDFSAQSATEQRRFITRKLRCLARKLTGRRTASTVDLEAVIDVSHFPENELRLWEIHLQALLEHIQQPFPGRVVLLRTRGQPLLCSLEEDFGWRKLASAGTRVILIPGSHENIFIEPNVQTLASELARELAQAQQEAPSK